MSPKWLLRFVTIDTIRKKEPWKFSEWDELRSRQVDRKFQHENLRHSSKECRKVRDKSRELKAKNSSDSISAHEIVLNN